MDDGSILWTTDPIFRIRILLFRIRILFDGRRIRTLTIVDNFTRESLCTSANFQFKGVRVAEALEEVVKEHRNPEAIKVDNGPEFISKEIDLWGLQPWSKT